MTETFESFVTQVFQPEEGHDWSEPTTDSSPLKRRPGSVSPQPLREVSISSATLNLLAARHQSEGLLAMRLVRDEWKVQDLQKLQDRDSKRHTGNIAIETQVQNGDIRAAAAMVNHYHLPPVQTWTINEIAFKTEVELILLNIMSTIQLPATRSVSFSPPSHFIDGSSQR